MPGSRPSCTPRSATPCWRSASTTCRAPRPDLRRSLLSFAQRPDQLAQALHVIRDDPTPLRTLVRGLIVFLGSSRIVGRLAHVRIVNAHANNSLTRVKGFQRGKYEALRYQSQFGARRAGQLG